MNIVFVWLLVVCCMITTSSCASRHKTNSRIYEGEGPNIKYLRERETAGGRVGGGR